MCRCIFPKRSLLGNPQYRHRDHLRRMYGNLALQPPSCSSAIVLIVVFFLASSLEISRKYGSRGWNTVFGLWLRMPISVTEAIDRVTGTLGHFAPTPPLALQDTGYWQLEEHITIGAQISLCNFSQYAHPILVQRCRHSNRCGLVGIHV